MDLWIYGIHTVKAYIEQYPCFIRKAFCLYQTPTLSPRLRDLCNRLTALSLHVDYVHRRTLDAVCEGGVHQGIALQIAQKLHKEKDPYDFFSRIDNDNRSLPPLMLLLDGIMDPQNLGACFRSAAAAGACGLIMTEARSSFLSAAARKAACGASETLPFLIVRSLPETIKRLQNERNMHVIGLQGEAKYSIYELSDCMLSNIPLALVLGNEEKGLSKQVRETCNQLCKIPISKNVQSLNVSAACAIACFEIQRRRHISLAKAPTSALNPNTLRESLVL